MRIYFVLLLSLTLAIILRGCGNSNVTTQDHFTAQRMLHITKGSCHGKCPQYELNIYADKSVTYNGIRFVDIIGEKKITLSEIDYETLTGACFAVNLNNLGNEYVSPARDLQLTTFKFRAKQIRYHTGKAPGELVSLVDVIESIVFPLLK